MSPLHPLPTLLFFLLPRPAQCLRSIPKSRSLHPRSHLNRLLPSCRSRPFTTTSPLHAGGPKDEPKSMGIKQPARKATNIQMREANVDYAKGTMDLGLMEQIFIKPERNKLPRWFEGWDSFKDRVKLEVHAAKAKMMGYFGLLYFNKWFSKPRLPLGLRQRKTECLSLHRVMYTALAVGDLPTLRLICADGLYQFHAAQIQRRVHIGGKPLFWEHVRYTGRVKVVADIAARMEVEGLGVRQCVVKIPSLQRLSEPVGEGYETKDKVQGNSRPERMLREMETTEYIVMQKKVMNGKEGEWVLWGTVEPSKWQTGQLRRSIAGSF